MAGNEQQAEPDLFEKMVQTGHATLALALADGDGEPTSERERELVNAAVEAGVLGALEVLRGH